MKKRKESVENKLEKIEAPRYKLFRKVREKYPEVKSKDLNVLLMDLSIERMIRISEFTKILVKNPNIFIIHFERMTKKVGYFKRLSYLIEEKLFFMKYK